MNIPDYISDKKNSVTLVVFTAIFALIFINLYKPFSSSSWYPVSDFIFFVYSSLIILTGVLVVLISRIIMYFYSRKHKITYPKYALWVFFEVLFMSLFYTIYTLSVNESRDAMSVFKSSFINTALVILLPYTVLWFYFGWKESALKLEKVLSAQERNTPEYGIISFKDEKGLLRISVHSRDLLYIESSDNYVNIYYDNNGKLKKYLLRNRLKTLEEQLSKTNVVRCHRSYLVNLERVKVIRRENEFLFMELDMENTIDIQVSKSYMNRISEKFLSHP